MDFARSLFRGLSSFGFAVVLLLFLLLLTWLGTLEQVEFGLYEVQRRYFDSLFVVHWAGPFNLRLPAFDGGFHWSSHEIGSIPLPLPGVYLLLGLLLMNLVLGGIVRLKKSSRTAGILVAHLGIVMMLVAGFVKFKFSVEGNLALSPPGYPRGDFRYPQRSQGDVFQSYHDWELVLHEAVPEGKVVERLIPVRDFEFDLKSGPVRYTRDDLPFDVLITKHFRNARVVPKGPMFAGDSAVIDGYVVREIEPNPEAELNIPAVVATFVERATGKNTDALLSGMQDAPLTVAADGSQWIVDLRKKRYPLPFAIRVDKFTFETHPGTTMASVYLSDVTKIEDGREQSLKITMNEPLRHEGYTLYQSSFGPQGVEPGDFAYTVFAVVKNPSDQWPKWSCYVIAVGLLWHFGARLLRFIKSQQPPKPQHPIEPSPPEPIAATESVKSRPMQAVRSHP